ncbi:MAG: molecular chaperone DnaK [Proteobacteria bacterium]|nr:molecular chaperone DnaK [Pseudomonadota bacterium]
MAQKSKKPAKAKPVAKKASPIKKPIAKAKPQAKVTPASKKPTPSKKPAATLKKAAPAKKAAPIKKPAPVSKKPAPKKAVPVAKKAAPLKKTAPAKKSAPAQKTALTKKTTPVKKVVPIKKAAPVKAQKMPVVVIKKGKEPVKVTGWVAKQRERLLQLKDTLLDSMSGVGRDSLRNRAEGGEASAFGMHTADAGSDAYDRDFALSLLSQERDSLFEIDAALKKINDGNYGFCELSGKPIPHNRLEALPFARYTVECQAELEKTNRLTRVRQPVTSLFGLGEEGESESEEEDTTTDTKD